MRVEAELLDHPKLFRLERKIGQVALKVILRLWGHCQASQRGERWFGADPDYVEAVARWEGDAGVCYRALVEVGFLDEVDGTVVIHDWEAMNHRTVSAWRGGAVRKQTATSRTQLNPKGKPNPNHAVEPKDDLKGLHQVDLEGNREGKVYECMKGGMSEGVCEGDQHTPSEASNPSSPEDGGSIVEIPSLDEALAFAATSQAGVGELIGAPPIEMDWVKNWWEWRSNNTSHGFEQMRSWRLQLLRDWRKQWVSWQKRAKAAEKGAATGSTWGLQAQIRAVEAELREHPGNPQNTVGALDRKQREKPAYDALRRRLQELRKAIAAQEVTS